MAIYNNGYPMGYPQMVYPQQYQQPTPQQAQNNNGIIWVQGEAGAKSYLVAPNTTVQLWDSENQRIYLKSADASGMPSMKVLEYTIREGGSAQNPAVKTDNTVIYATKDEITALNDEIAALRQEVDSLSKRRIRREADNE